MRVEFFDILRCLLFLVKRLGDQLWQGEGLEYPQVVFDAIKDNSSFSGMLQGLKSADEKPWFLSWFGEYLTSVSDSTIYGDILARIVDFLCEELQHERFQDARPAVMFSAIRVSSSTSTSDPMMTNLHYCSYWLLRSGKPSRIRLRNVAWGFQAYSISMPKFSFLWHSVAHMQVRSGE